VVIETKLLASFSTNDKHVMKSLTYLTGEMRWRLHGNHPKTSLASAVRNPANTIIGWAVADLRLRYMGAIMVGVFVDHRYRRRGIAKMLMTSLVRHLAEMKPGEAIWCDHKIRSWMKPIIRSNKMGFLTKRKNASTLQPTHRHQVHTDQ
jgi:GNAT superfamily N-acetyltransferase